MGGALEHSFFLEERQRRTEERYRLLLPQYPDKSPEWWFDTHGVDIDAL